MKRSKFSLSHYKLATFDMGELVPVACYEVLPGDTIQQATSALIRLSPLISPVMHPVHVRIHHWYVPYRILWDDWEDFITGGPGGQGAQTEFPYMVAPDKTVGSLWDYFGLPPNPDPAVTVSALPFRAYNLIWNEWYRDQDLQSEANIHEAGGPDGVTEFTLRRVAWEKDYFTSARPWSQKGPEVVMPLGVTAPVISTGDGVPHWTVSGTDQWLGKRTSQSTAYFEGASVATNGTAAWRTTALAADLTNATPASINDLRRSFALQRYAEARAKYGSRYTEYLRFLGVRSSDARLQRPEYLGGGKQTIQFSEVLQTGPGSTDGSPVPGGVGALAGHGIGAMRSNRYRRFFEEHGVVLSLMSVKPKTMYADGIPRMWSRREKEDFWQRELQHIGQQEVRYKEIYAAHTLPEDVFGYQDRYDEYRRCESGISGDFRTTLNYWHLARQFGAYPTLNGAFIEANPSKRIFQEQTKDSLWCMVNHSIQARRMVSSKGTSFIF